MDWAAEAQEQWTGQPKHRSNGLGSRSTEAMDWAAEAQEQWTGLQ